MEASVSSRRFSARIRRRTAKAEEIHEDQLEYAKLDSPSVAKEGRFRKDQDIDKGGTLDATATSLNKVPKRQSKKLRKAQDMGDIEEAEGAAGITRLNMSLVLQATVNSPSEISGGKNDTLIGLPGIEAGESRDSEETLMEVDFTHASPRTPQSMNQRDFWITEETPIEVDFTHASPRTPQSMNQRDFWATDEISYLLKNSIVDQEANSQTPVSGVEDGVGLNPQSAPHLAQPDLYELQEEFSPPRQRDISIYEDPFPPGVKPEEFAYRYEFEKLYEDSDDYFFL